MYSFLDNLILLEFLNFLTNLALVSCKPVSSKKCVYGNFSLFSGGYMLLHTPKGKDVTIDFQFSAPLSASKDMFKKDKSRAEKVYLTVCIQVKIHLWKGLQHFS